MNSQNRQSDSLREAGKGVGYGRDLPDSLIVNDCRLPDSSEQSLLLFLVKFHQPSLGARRLRIILQNFTNQGLKFQT
jgi:hypothetical protein